MIELDRFETYLMTHARCAVAESRAAFIWHLSVFISTTALLIGYSVVWEPIHFPMTLMSLGTWSVAVWLHYRYGVKRVQAELEGCVGDLVEHIETKAEMQRLREGWKATALR